MQCHMQYHMNDSVLQFFHQIFYLRDKLEFIHSVFLSVTLWIFITSLLKGPKESMITFCLTRSSSALELLGVSK